MTRHQSRVNAFLLAFQLPSNSLPLEEIVSESAGELELETDEFCELILKNTLENLEDIDGAVSPHLKNWSLVRLPRVSLAVLRISCAQIFYMKDIPLSVVINEAVEIAKEYGDEEEYSFVNGVLRSVADRLGLE
ncbi:MAG: transcription antitermination factor NusB [Oscillospiraceae bacterium]|nr:transcription antitermination factor NusB [Oscillospiraceae bacterium]